MTEKPSLKCSQLFGIYPLGGCGYVFDTTEQPPKEYLELCYRVVPLDKDKQPLPEYDEVC